jgi:hypothetical protein
LGWNLTRYSARNRTRSCRRCSRGSGRSSGGNGRTSSPRRSPGYSSGRNFGGTGDSYGGGIGGVAARREDRRLEIEDLGRDLAVGGTYTIMYILRLGNERQS